MRFLAVSCPEVEGTPSTFPGGAEGLDSVHGSGRVLFRAEIRARNRYALLLL